MTVKTTTQFLSNNEDTKRKHNFGILNIKTPATNEMNPGRYHIIATCDRSGPMDDVCEDKKTKMDHLKHTLKNIVRHFSKVNPDNITVLLTIVTFDTEVETSPLFKISKCTQKSIIEYIDDITPRGATNIEKVLTDVNEMFQHYQENDTYLETYDPEYEQIETIHLFLTDGDVTSGEDNPTKLIECVNPNVPNIFIGYGIHHNSHLLNVLAEKTSHNSYYFIESYENAGMAYGDILYASMYKYIENIQIKVKHGKIYDYRTDTWEKTLEIPSITSGITKTYHIHKRFENTKEIKISIEYNKPNQHNRHTLLNVDVEYPDQPGEKNKEVEKFWYRQKTQEHMFDAQEILNSIDSSSSQNKLSPEEIKQLYDDKKEKQEELTTFLTTMKEYMEENEYTQDTFMKNLCDDIYIAYKSLNSNIGRMYLTSRTSSQGEQRGYNIGNIDELTRSTNQGMSFGVPNPSRSSVSFCRSNSCGSNYNYPEEECAQAESFTFHSPQAESAQGYIHVLSNNEDGVYANKQQSDMMRSLSQN